MENLCVKLLVVVGIAGIAGVAFITLTGSDKKEEDAATCPEYSGLEPFDLAAFSGLWYEVERYPNPRLEGQSCIRVTYQESSSNETGSDLWLSNWSQKWYRVPKIGPASRILVKKSGKWNF